MWREKGDDASRERLREDAKEGRVPGPRVESPPKICWSLCKGMMGAGQPVIPWDAAFTTTSAAGTSWLSSLQSGDILPWRLKALPAAGLPAGALPDMFQDFAQPFHICHNTMSQQCPQDNYKTTGIPWHLAGWLGESHLGWRRPTLNGSLSRAWCWDHQ